MERHRTFSHNTVVNSLAKTPHTARIALGTLEKVVPTSDEEKSWQTLEIGSKVQRSGRYGGHVICLENSPALYARKRGWRAFQFTQPP